MDNNAIIAYIYCAVAAISASILIYNSIIVTKITSKYSINRNVFYAFLFAGLAAIFDCAYILRENEVIYFSPTLNYIFTLMYVSFATLTGVFWVVYSEKKQNSFFAKTKKRFSLYCLPLVLSFVLIISTPLTHVYFYFEENHYQRGSLFGVLSILLFAYVIQTGVCALIKSFKKENYVDRNEYRRLFSFAIVYMVIQSIQLTLPPIFPYRSVGIMLVYYVFLVQNMKETIGQDALTHINNRFESERMLASKIKNKEKFEVAIIDVDKFKSINDEYGHQEGDKALQYVSSALSECVDRTCFIGRMGGDEFIFINSDTNNSIINIEESINNNLSSILEEHNCEYRFTVSIGYALKDENINSIPDLISLADSKLYERKSEKHKKK